MPTIPLGAVDANRRTGRLPKFRLRNVYLERDESNAVDGLVRLQRPGLAPFATLEAGPINGVFARDGVFKGDNLVVSGSTLSRVNAAGVVTALGTVGNDRAQTAASDERAIVVNGGVAWSTDGLTVTQVIMPDGLPVSSVAFLSGFFFLAVRDTQRIFYVAPGETNPDALSFFEAERTPDAVRSLAVVGDELWILGAAEEEIFVLTGDIDAPAQRINARAYSNGCAARDSAVNVDGALIWVTKDFRVCMATGDPQTISSPALSEHLRKADPETLRAWFYKLDGHLFYILTSNRDTFVYDVTMQIWPRWSSYGADTWRAHLGAGLIAGDADSGKLWRLDPTRSNDDGENMVRELTGFVELVGAPQRCNSVSVRLAAGWTPTPTLEPMLELCWSDDEGNTYSPWLRISMGKQGEFRAPVVVRKLGMMRRPGRLFWFRFTDDALLRVSYAQMNEAFQ